MKNNKINSKQLTSYNIDPSRLSGIAIGVIFPLTPEDIKNIVKTKNEDLVPRGGGTNLVGGCVPNNSLIIDLSKMYKITNFNPKKGTVKVEAGTTIKELNEKLNALGFDFPIKIPNPSSTIGGMIAMNATGNYNLKYGSIKDWIQEIEFINGRGELMKTTKSDISEVCGMEGITGIISSATLNIIKKTNNSISIFQSENIDEILAISRRLKLEKEVIMLQLLPPFLSKLLEFPAKFNLIIEFNTEKGKIRGEQYNKFSKIINKLYYKIYSEKYYNIESPKFFFDKIGEFISFLELNNIHYFAFLGSGIIYPIFRDEEKEKRDAVIEYVKKSSNKPSNFGIGLLKKYFVDNSEKKILQRIKLRHDPFGKFNKGKLIDMDYKEKSLAKFEETRKKPMQLPQQFISNKIQNILSTKKTTIISNQNNIEIKKQDPINSELIHGKSQGIGKPSNMEELINEAKKIDEIEKQREAKEIEPLLKSANQQIFSSDSSENKKFIQDFTKNIAKSSPNLSQSTKQSKQKVDYRNIQDIMNNKYPPSQNSNFSIQNNLERNHTMYQKPKTSKEDQDLIDSIMTNKSPKKEQDKKDEHRNR